MPHPKPSLTTVGVQKTLGATTASNGKILAGLGIMLAAIPRVAGQAISSTANELANNISSSTASESIAENTLDPGTVLLILLAACGGGALCGAAAWYFCCCRLPQSTKNAGTEKAPLVLDSNKSGSEKEQNAVTDQANTQKEYNEEQREFFHRSSV